MKSKWQSKQKHAFIEAYLKIWAEKVKENAPSLSIVDLNAGWGWCYDPEVEKPPWEGSAVLSARCLRDYQTKRGKFLFLNSYSPAGGLDQQRQRDAVIDAVDVFRQPRSAFDLKVIAMPIEEAVETALKDVNLEFPTVWLLDPYKPVELPWTVVEKVISRKHEWQDSSGTRQRRPEVFISLMTHDLQRNVDNYPNSMSICLGQPEEVWRPELENLISQGLNKRDAALELYLRQLRKHYTKEPFTLEIASAHGNIVYVLIFCTDQDPGYHMMRTDGLPAYRVWHEKKWEKPAEQISATRRERRKAENAGQKLGRLDDFS